MAAQVCQCPCMCLHFRALEPGPAADFESGVRRRARPCVARLELSDCCGHHGGVQVGCWILDARARSRTTLPRRSRGHRPASASSFERDASPPRCSNPGATDCVAGTSPRRQQAPPHGGGSWLAWRHCGLDQLVFAGILKGAPRTNPGTNAEWTGLLRSGKRADCRVQNGARMDPNGRTPRITKALLYP
jgi:hypothetical protein